MASLCALRGRHSRSRVRCPALAFNGILLCRCHASPVGLPLWRTAFSFTVVVSTISRFLLFPRPLRLCLLIVPPPSLRLSVSFTSFAAPRPVRFASFCFRHPVVSLLTARPLASASRLGSSRVVSPLFLPFASSLLLLPLHHQVSPLLPSGVADSFPFLGAMTSPAKY